jgi:hypothetical protein
VNTKDCTSPLPSSASLWIAGQKLLFIASVSILGYSTLGSVLKLHMLSTCSGLLGSSAALLTLFITDLLVPCWLFFYLFLETPTLFWCRFLPLPGEVLLLDLLMAISFISLRSWLTCQRSSLSTKPKQLQPVVTLNCIILPSSDWLSSFPLYLPQQC